MAYAISQNPKAFLRMNDSFSPESVQKSLERKFGKNVGQGSIPILPSEEFEARIAVSRSLVGLGTPN